MNFFFNYAPGDIPSVLKIHKYDLLDYFLFWQIKFWRIRLSCLYYWIIIVASVGLTNLLAGQSRAVRFVYLRKIQDTIPYTGQDAGAGPTWHDPAQLIVANRPRRPQERLQTSAPRLKFHISNLSNICTCLICLTFLNRGVTWPPLCNWNFLKILFLYLMHT